MKKGSMNNPQYYVTDSSSKVRQCHISKIPSDLGTPLATVFCSRTSAAFTMKHEQDHGQLWSWDAGVSQARHREEKKKSQSSDSSALHVTSVSTEESGHRRCLGTKYTLCKKKKKATSVGGGGSSKGQ